MSYTAEFPIGYIPNPDKFGALASGDVYFGVPNGSPATVPGDRIQVYAARQGLSDLAISQPIDIGPGGEWWYNGQPVQIKVLVPYCVQVMNSLGVQKYYAPAAGDEIAKFIDIDAQLLKLIKTVPTFAALSSTSANIGQIVITLGHTNEGIGGGIFNVVSAGALIANNGTIAINGGIAFKLRYEYLTPELFGGGIGGNDKAAVEAAAAALPAAGGTLRIAAKRYHSTTGFLFQRNNLTVIGEAMPKVSNSLNALESGSIFDGTVLFDGDNITVENVGADHGITFSNTYKAGAGGDGFVAHDATLGSLRKNNKFKNVIGLTRIGDYTDPQAAYHAVLIEGIRGGAAENVEGVGGWFGVVLKVADFNGSGLIGRENDSASVYLKSNLYAPVDRVNLTGIITSNYIARGNVGFLIQASDAELQTVTASGITVMGGGTPVRVEGEVAQPCVAVALSNVTTRDTTGGISVRGPVYGFTLDGGTVWDPDGTGFETAANTATTHPNDVTVSNLRIVPSATTTDSVYIGIDSTKAALNNINAAGPGGALIAGSVINIRRTTDMGQYFGYLRCAGVNWALVNGWTPAFVGQTVGLIVKGGFTQGYGRISSAAATNDIFMTVPAGMRPNNLEFYTTMTGYNGAASQYQTVTVKVSAGGDVSLFPDRATYAALSYFSLTDFKIPTAIPVEGGI
jgi:hypothetical protein